MKNWDPKPSERTYYRSREDGQRAYIVKRLGKDMLRLDRPMEEILHPIDGRWVPDVQHHPLTPFAVAKVAFVADVALRQAMGQHVKPQDADWLSLKQEDRIQWMSEGPETGDIRDDLHDAIMGTLKGLVDGR